MVKGKRQVIKSINGDVLYEGIGETLKSFVENLVRERKSLANADLSKRDLSGLNLDGVIFDGACLDECDLRGISARKGSFVGASMRGVKAQGLIAENGKFMGVDAGFLLDVSGNVVESRFDGARLAFSDWDGSILTKAFFDGASLTKASLTRVIAKKTSFVSARLFDTDFSYGTFIGCLFSKSKMKVSRRVPMEHVPDRTFGAMSVNCKFDGVELDSTVDAFKKDCWWSKGLKVVSFLMSSVAVVASVHSLNVEESIHTLSEMVGEGKTIAFMTIGAVVLKDLLSEKARDFMEDYLEEFEMGVRHFAENLQKVGANLKTFVKVAVFGPGGKAVGRALRETKEEKEGSFRKFFCKSHQQATLIYADRKHLALALEALSSGKLRHRLNGDVILVRNDVPARNAPNIIRYKKDGGTSLVWLKDEKIVSKADFDMSGNLLQSYGDEDTGKRLSPYLRGFEKAALKENGVELNYDDETHAIQAGDDGSILILNKTTKRLDNRHGASIITIGGIKRYFRNGIEEMKSMCCDRDMAESQNSHAFLS